MDEKILASLKESISQWERAHKGILQPIKDDRCPLRLGFRCKEGCPVYLRTGLPYCLKTPYWWYMAWLSRMSTDRNYEEIRWSLAQDEVDFLKSLLPKNEEKVT